MRVCRDRFSSQREAWRSCWCMRTLGKVAQRTECHLLRLPSAAAVCKVQQRPQRAARWRDACAGVSVCCAAGRLERSHQLAAARKCLPVLLKVCHNRGQSGIYVPAGQTLGSAVGTCMWGGAAGGTSEWSCADHAMGLCGQVAAPTLTHACAADARTLAAGAGEWVHALTGSAVACA